MNSKNEVFEYLIDQLRQQVNNNKCEDLAREVQSLKNQLRDASALVAELMGTITLMNGDVEAYKILRKGGCTPGGKRCVVGEHGPEQSGCRKEDVQECPHLWHYYDDHLVHCALCGLKRSDEEL